MKLRKTEGEPFSRNALDPEFVEPSHPLILCLPNPFILELVHLEKTQQNSNKKGITT